ncbi:hypothetical protein PS652_02054 [Pseudomonas fluorescens]|uniref:Uncharacterized protein n=1 Tax=Pseudomonas fluorescens TaxID=294 RepID=A0A5E6RG57_PSEFL|nr:hypothetical protein PS652_01580 [Pseudomonas fluorescens]
MLRCESHAKLLSHFIVKYWSGMLDAQNNPIMD